MATIEELITSAESQYIPGVNYTNYFNAAINAAQRAGQQVEANILARLQDSWNNWSQSNTISNYAGDLTKSEVKKLANAAQATLDAQTKAITDVHSALEAELKTAKTGEEYNAILAGYSSKLMDAVYKAEDEATTASKTFQEGPKADTTSTTDAKAAYDEWKKTGLDPNITDPKILAEYQTLKSKDLGVTNVKDSGVKGPVYATPTLDLATALKDYGVKGLLPDKRLNAPLYNQLMERIAAGTRATTAADGYNPLIGTGPEALAKYLSTKPQNVKVDLPADYGARSAVQDIMLTNARNNPGMYATGQFDPFYSGVARTSLPTETPTNVMNEKGVFEKGAGTVAPNVYGYGFQNAYEPPASTVGSTTGAAAGGYMNAQTVSQQNQNLQQNQNPNVYSLGLGAIPNMSEYTNYTGNPGITTPTQDGDDGSVGGVPVPGQTNPVW